MNAEPPTDNVLGRFLRERRGRITLAEAGLPGRRSGRGATLTQEDLARLTGYSIRTISALEQGSEHRPSRPLLDAITAALRLSGEERRILWKLAADSPAPEWDFAVEPDPNLTRIAQLVDPHPAYVCDAVYNVQSYNTAFANWVCDFSTVPVEQRNIAKWIFLDGHAQHVVVNRERDTPPLVARIRAIHMLLPRAMAPLVDELCDRSAEFRRLWDAGTEVNSYPTATIIDFRPPGHTDPRQPGDDEHHVPLTMSTLTPMAPDDNRRVSVFLLPEGFPEVSSERSRCAACARGE